MMHRLSPRVRALFREGEKLVMVLRGGYGSVREYFISTDQRYMAVRELDRRVAATSFDRERELWIDLRPNRRGIDLIVSSSDTLDRIHGLSDADVESARTIFGIELGEFEEIVPLPDKMVKLFEGLPGSTMAEGESKPGSSLLFAITVILFSLLAYECGRHIGTIPRAGGETGWYILGAAALTATILVKSSFQVILFFVLGLPALTAGIYRDTPDISWRLSPEVLAAVIMSSFLVWFLSRILQWRYRNMGEGRRLPTRLPALTTTCLVLAGLVCLTLYSRLQLSNWRIRRTPVRSLAFHRTQCKLERWFTTPCRLVVYDNRELLVAPLGINRGGWEIWTHTRNAPSSGTISCKFHNGLLFHPDGSSLGAFDCTIGQDEWSFCFPQVVNHPDVICDLQLIDRKQEIRAVVTSGEVVLLDEKTGKPRWQRRYLPLKRPTPRRPILLSCPADFVVPFVAGGMLCSIDADTGELLWSTSQEKDDPEPMCTASSLVGISGSILWARSLKDGTYDWRVKAPANAFGRLFKSPSGLVGVPVRNGKPAVVFFDPTNGKRLSQSVSPLPRPDGRIDVSQAEKGFLTWSTGIFRFKDDSSAPYAVRLRQPTIGCTLASPPVLSDGLLFLATSTCFVCCVDDRSGVVLWEYRTKGPAAYGGMIATESGPLVLTETGLVYSFNRTISTVR